MSSKTLIFAVCLFICIATLFGGYSVIVSQQVLHIIIYYSITSLLFLISVTGLVLSIREDCRRRANIQTESYPSLRPFQPLPSAPPLGV